MEGALNIYLGSRKYMKIRGMIKVCERCGYDDEPRILGVHHKDRNPKNNTLENIEVLCPNCHSLEHMKHTVQKYSAFVVIPPQKPGPKNMKLNRTIISKDNE